MLVWLAEASLLLRECQIAAEKCNKRNSGQETQVFIDLQQGNQVLALNLKYFQSLIINSLMNQHANPHNHRDSNVQPEFEDKPTSKKLRSFTQYE